MKRQQTRPRTNKPKLKTFGNKAYGFYNDRKWRNVSKIVRLEHPMCEVFPDEVGKYADHIVPIQADANGMPTTNGGAPYDKRNIMVMSTKAHNIKRGKERHGFVVDSVRTETGLIPKNREDIIKAIKSKYII